MTSRTIGGQFFEYMADDYMPGLRLTREERQKAKERIKKPFVTAGEAQGGVDGARSVLPAGPVLRAAPCCPKGALSFGASLLPYLCRCRACAAAGRPTPLVPK